MILLGTRNLGNCKNCRRGQWLWGLFFGRPTLIYCLLPQTKLNLSQPRQGEGIGLSRQPVMPVIGTFSKVEGNRRMAKTIMFYKNLCITHGFYLSGIRTWCIIIQLISYYKDGLSIAALVTNNYCKIARLDCELPKNKKSWFGIFSLLLLVLFCFLSHSTVVIN